MFPYLALATSAEWTTFILSSVLLGKRILSCNINGCPRRAKWLIHIVLSTLSLHASNGSVLDLHTDKEYRLRFETWGVKERGFTVINYHNMSLYSLL